MWQTVFEATRLSTVLPLTTSNSACSVDVHVASHEAAGGLTVQTTRV